MSDVEWRQKAEDAYAAEDERHRQAQDEATENFRKDIDDGNSDGSEEDAEQYAKVQDELETEHERILADLEKIYGPRMKLGSTWMPFSSAGGPGGAVEYGRGGGQTTLSVPRLRQLAQEFRAIAESFKAIIDKCESTPFPESAVSPAAKNAVGPLQETVDRIVKDARIGYAKYMALAEKAEAAAQRWEEAGHTAAHESSRLRNQPEREQKHVYVTP
ncbi:MAG: hypothetical protein ACRCY9_17460 [Phycicoccus sp.]